MMAPTSANTQVKTVEVGLSRRAQAGLAALLGLGLFLGVAFAQPNLIHNAAHDARHGIAVPCH